MKLFTCSLIALSVIIEAQTSIILPLEYQLESAADEGKLTNKLDDWNYEDKNTYNRMDLYKLMSLLRPYGSSKRNFDELDGSRFGYLKKKRNFDQLDSAGFGSFGRHF